MNTKVALVAGGDVLSVRGRPYEIQHAPQALVALRRDLAAEVSGGAPETAHAVTMTAELSQVFRTKRDGVAFVLDAVTTAFPSSLVRVFSVGGCFLSVADARRVPLDVAAANWAATAHAVARHHPDTLLIDIGTTSTDIIPIAGGAVVAAGRTDPARLATGELVYTGAVRTPAEAIASRVKVGRLMMGVSAEGFALAGDVHVWRGTLDPADYTSPTPDGGRRPAGMPAGVSRGLLRRRDMFDERPSSIADALQPRKSARHRRHRRVCAPVATDRGRPVLARSSRQRQQAAGLQ